MWVREVKGIEGWEQGDELAMSCVRNAEGIEPIKARY
jgi:hypothetical protein